MSKELLEQFEKEFDIMKEELKFKPTLKELDDIFFMKDFILSAKFVSPTLSRMVCSRIVDTYNLWIGFYHAMIVPNPNSMINIAESQVFNDVQKHEFIAMINKMKALISQNIVNGLTKDKSFEAMFIDDSVALWRELSPSFLKDSINVNDYWKKESIAKKS